MHFPKVYVLNTEADGVEREKVIEIIPNSSDAKIVGEDIKSTNPDSLKEKNKPSEGTISQISVRQKKIYPTLN